MMDLIRTGIDNCNASIAFHTAQLERYENCVRGASWLVAGEWTRLLQRVDGVPAIAPHTSNEHMCGVIYFPRDRAEHHAAVLSAETGEPLRAISDRDWHRAQIAESRATLAQFEAMAAQFA